MTTIGALTGLISGAIGLIGTIIGAILRYTSGQQKELRLLRARQDAAEPYIFQLRSQLREHGVTPLSWPRLLGYLSDTDEQPERRRDDIAP